MFMFQKNIVTYNSAQAIDLIPILHTIELSCYDETIITKSAGPGGIVQGYLNHLDTQFEFTVPFHLYTFFTFFFITF